MEPKILCPMCQNALDLIEHGGIELDRIYFKYFHQCDDGSNISVELVRVIPALEST